MRVYRASGLGGCMKAQIAAHLGFTPLSTDRFMENYAREGQLHEDEIVARFGEVTSRQAEVYRQVTPTVRLEGHVDGIRHEAVFEVKSMGDDTYRRWIKDRWNAGGMLEKYKWQLSAYMEMTGLPAHFVAKNRNDGKVSEAFVDVPFYTWPDIMGRILEMEKWVRRGELPDDCDVNNYPCPFYYLEQQLTMELAEDEVLDELAQMYEEASLGVKVAEARKKEARHALDVGLGTREKVVTAKSRVTYYEVKGSKVDISKMEEDGIDVERYKVPTVRKQLRVTVKHEPDGDSGGDDGDGTQDSESGDMPSE